MEKVEEVFLDTTIQIDRYYTLKQDKEKINKELENKTLISSSYVLGEFVAAFIADAILFHKTLSDEASATPMEALIRFSTIASNRPRSYNRIHKLLSNIGADINNKEKVKLRLEMFIENLFIERFKSLDIYINETGCVRANPQIKKNGNLYELDHGCSQRKKPKCDIKAFLELNHNEVADIISNKEPKDIAENLNEISAGKKQPVGRACWGIGDAVIALEMPDEKVVLYTTNEKDYKPICKSINKNYFNPIKNKNK
ncbi:hypothetical protein Q0N30_12390 [Priestia megaterium]|uniref:hypothetical protein n=1 Tax=Priestia megaterium TaxID=1404 RepID=UPI0034583738